MLIGWRFQFFLKISRNSSPVCGPSARDEEESDATLWAESDDPRFPWLLSGLIPQGDPSL